MVTAEDVSKLRQQYTNKQIKKGKVTADMVSQLRQQYTQPVVSQPVVNQTPQQPVATQPVMTQAPARQVTSHATQARQGQQQLAQKQQAINTAVNKPMTSYVNSGGRLTDTASIEQFAREQGVPEKEIQYQIGRINAANTPTTTKTPKMMPSVFSNSEQINKLQFENAKQNNPVTMYDKNFGKQEAKEEIQNLDFTNNKNGDKYLEYKEGLKEAKANNDTRNISKYETLLNDYKNIYKSTSGGQKDTTNIPAVRKSLESLTKDVQELEIDYANARTDAEKLQIAQQYLRVKDLYNDRYKLYADAMAYDEIMNNNIWEDSAKSWDKGVRAGMAKTINGGWSVINRATGLNAADVDAVALLKWNNGEKGDMYAASEAGDTDLAGATTSANDAWRRFERIHNAFPDSIKLNNLYNQINTGTYKGTANDLMRDLNEVAKDVYQTFKDAHTQDELDAQAEQLRHNELYGDMAWLPNATNTVGEMTPSMLVGYATGGIGELAGGGSMVTAGTIANIAQQTGSFGTLGLSAGSAAMDKALAEGAKYNQAFNYGVLSGATEVGTEMLGGETVNKLFGQYGKTALGKVFGKAIDQLNIESKVGRFLANQASGVASEMTEEMISEALNPLWEVITYNPNALPSNIDEIGQYFKNILNAGVEAIPSTLMMQGAGMATQAMNVQTIENGLIKSINENTELSQIVKNQLINEVRKASADVKLGIEETNYMEQRANEREQELSAQSENMKQRIPQGFSLPQATVDTLAYVENNRPGLNISFDTNIKGNGTFTENADGTRTITLNPNSKRAVEFTLTHELGHDLKGTNEYAQLQKILTDYAKGKPNYEKSLKALNKTYQDSGANYNLQDEATNDMLGQAIGEQEFYNKLAENPTLFNRVTNGLKNLLGNKDTKLKNKIEKLTSNALKQEYRGKQEGTQQSLPEYPAKVSDIKNITRYIANAMENETDKTWKARLRDAYFANAEILYRKHSSPLQEKRKVLQQYLDYKNGNTQYSLSEAPTQDNQLKNSNQSSFSMPKTATIDNLTYNVQGAEISPYQRNISKKWDIDSIQRQLKKEESPNVPVKAEMDKFSNLDELKDNIFYHGSTNYHGNLKAGSTLPEDARTGGYGEAYHTISLSKNKNIASNFASQGAYGVVTPVLLRKDARVIEMPNIEDSIELEDILPELWQNNIDAVKIGDWDIENKGYGEQEIVILNPNAIVVLGKGRTDFKNYGKPKFENLNDEQLETLYQKYKDDEINDLNEKIKKEANTQKRNELTKQLENLKKQSVNDIGKETLSYDTNKISSWNQFNEYKNNLVERINSQYGNDAVDIYASSLAFGTILTAKNNITGQEEREVFPAYYDDEEVFKSIKSTLQNLLDKVGFNIQYSKSNNTWQQFLEDNLTLNPNGTRTNFTRTDTTMLPSNEELQQQENKGVKAILKDLKIPTNEELQQARTESVANEPINKITTNKPLDELRDFKEVGNRKVNAYQYDNPEVKPFFQQEAKNMLIDLKRAIKGERTATWNNEGELNYTGISRETTDDIADLLDGNNGVKLSYNDIQKGLEAIITDKGSENVAAAKRIEIILDKRLREGYTDSYGDTYEPNENYLNFLAGKNFIEPAEYEKQVAEKMATENETLFSLSEEQQKEINDYISKLNNDTTIDNNFKDQILTRFDNLTDYKQFQNIKQDVEDYKEKAYQGIKSLVDVANIKPEDVRQRPMEYTQRKDKNTSNQRGFFGNMETSNIISDETKNRVNATTYEKKANTDTLNEVMETLDERGNDMVEEWKHKTKNFTAKDVALGAILIERYQQNGDWNSAARAVEKLADMGTEAGRAVQMYSIFQRLSPQTMAIYQQKALNQAFEDMKKRKTGKWVEANKDKFKLTEEDTKFIYDQVEKASQAIDEETKQRELSKIEARINEKLPPENGQSLKALRRMAMLFNPKTQVRNIVGNALIMPVNDVADLIGTAIDKAVARKTGVRTTSTANLKTKAQGFAKGVQQAVKDYKTGTRTAATGSKWEFDVGAKPFNENTGSTIKNAINRKLNGINDLLSAVMSGGDRPFYEAAYQNSLEGQIKANKVKEATPDMVDIAVNEALQRTWNDDNEYTSTVLKIRKAMNNINIKGFGLGDLIIPFAKTPANLTKAMVEYSPAGFIESVIDFNDMRKAISRGEMTPQQQKKFVASTSKAIAGTILYLIAGTLAKSGKITGSADDDKDVKNFEQNVLGIQPYSVRLGDKTYTYSWANPINAPLAIMADTYKMTKENASKWDILNNAFKVAGETLVDNSFLSGIKDLFGKDSISEGLVDAIESFPESLIPTFMSQIASLADNTQRQTFEYKNDLGTIANKIKNKLPGARNTLQPQVNTFGEEIENQNNAFNAFLNPANVREAKITDSQKALYDVYQETKDKTIFPMQAPYYTNTDIGEKKNLTSKDRTTYQKASGQYVSEAYDGLFDDKTFKDLRNEGKVKILHEIATDGNLKGRESVGAAKTVSNSDLSKLNYANEKLEEAGIPLADYYIAWYAKNNLAQGKTNDARRKAIRDYTDLTANQEEVLYEIFNIEKGSK